MLRSLLILSAGFICVTVWLLLLEVTDFSAVSVSAGLLGGLVLTGSVR